MKNVNQNHWRLLMSLVFISLMTCSLVQAQTTYQAESYSSQSGTSIVTSHAGYTGSGFVDYGGNGTWIQWNNINEGGSGSTTLTFRYANASSSNRECQLLLNGVSQGNVAFSPTGSWSNWSTATISVPLTSGNNTIRVTAITSSGGPNLDRLVAERAVSSNVPPSVSLTAPSNGASFTAGANITVSATASDSDGSVTSVEFFNGSTSLGVDTSSPYSVSISNAAAGTYNLTALATDNGSASTTSAARSITVESASTGDGTILVRARMLSGASDILELRINDQTIKSWTVSGSSYANYTHSGLSGSGNVKIWFRDQNTDVRLDYITVNSTTTLQAEAQQENTSVWENGSCGGDYSETMHCEGHINFGTINFGGGSSNVPPSVSITAPSNGATFTVGSNITVSANASDSDGSVTSVQFFNGSTSLGTDTSSPYSISISNASAGTYNLTAVAKDNNNATTTSAAVSVTVVSSPYPSNNPVAARYGNAYPWSSNIQWGTVVNVMDHGAVANGTTDNLSAFNAAASALASLGGGVIYFPAGSYYFSNDLLLPSNVVIRGANPLSGQDNALQSSFSLPTKFEFPKYVFTETGNGTANSTAFKFIILDPATANSASNVGIVNVDINRAGIGFSATDKVNATGENMVIMNVKTNNVGKPTPGVPDASKGQLGYQRHCFRFTFNINVYNKKNILIANTRNNDNVTDNYSYSSYWVDADGWVGPKGTPYELTGGKAKFNFYEHYGIEAGQGSGGCLAGTPETCPENFREGIVIRDNYIYHEMRVGILARGQGLIIHNNVIEDNSNKVAWIHPTGTRAVGNATTMENRGIDWSGYEVTVSDNNIQVYRHQMRDGPYLSVDGEGILHQECCGGTLIRGVDIVNNTVNSYIGLYKSQDIDDAYIAYNTVSTGDTDIDVIYVNANTNNANYKVDNTIIENNSVSGTLGNILVRGDGAAGTGNIIRNNTSTSGNINVSCLVNATMTNNTGFNIDPCSGPAARNTQDEIVGLDNIGINLYPNPTSDVVTLNLPSKSFANVYLFNTLGQNIYTNEAVSGDLEIPLAKFGRGIYIINIQWEGKLTSKKIIVN